MAAQAHPAGEGRTPPEVDHLRRFLAIWLAACVIAEPLVIWVLGPSLPPGKGSVQAAGQVTDNIVLMAMSTPVLLLVSLYLIYAVINFRAPRDVVLEDYRQAEGPVLEGPAIRGHAGLQTTWIVISSMLVLALAGYGTVTLLADNGAGSGSGPKPLTSPSGSKLQVQVIAQQWAFLYRWPQYGGVETAHLELPINRDVELHVTSLDVIHSFWALQLGVKADANPQVDNVAFVEPAKQGPFEIRCAELCGIWHGEMNDVGHVVSQGEFESWIHEQQTKYAAVTKLLPPYATTYQPEPKRRGG